MKKIIVILLSVILLFEIILLSDLKSPKWNSEAVSISPSGDYTLKIKASESNWFNAPYSVSDNKSNINAAEDFYIYECYTEPIITWDNNAVTIKSTDRKGDEIVYEIGIESSKE